MYKLIFVFITLCLSGCATTVHLVTNGYSKQEVNQFEQQLINKGFDVEINNILIPKNYPHSVIAISPAHKPAQDLSLLKDFIHDNKLEQATELRFGQSRHYYHQGHIGLYLRHPEINPEDAMPPYLASVGCKTGYATIAFRPDHTVEFETEIHQDGQYRLQFKQGNWLYDGNTLAITLDTDEEAHFSRRDITRETSVGVKPALLFSPITKNHFYAPLNCHFEVVFMD